ncbi:hypothetical protein BS78_04G261300 [Paspalum vaginatum]|nr:hypothetical protein BS78_04G261300 [Paspalum vaginatum]
MASSASPSPSTTTTTTIISLRFSHVLRIDDYRSTLNGDGRRPSFDSRSFSAGGRTWHIRYRPMGSLVCPENTDSISLYLVLDDVVDEAVNAQATFSLLDQDGKPVHGYCRTSPLINFSALRKRGLGYGYEQFIKREALERSKYLRDDCFAVAVNIHVVKASARAAAVPDSDMHRHLDHLLSSGEFRVSGETFSAHRLVLAARSPVFRAELYGPMREGGRAAVIQIDDMEPQVFRALLSFIYTDVWPEMEPEDECAMSQHLLVAADRYGLQRLKLMCQDTLLMRNHIDTGSVATILALAEQHHCPRLKQSCFKFLASPTGLAAIIGTQDFELIQQTCPTIVLRKRESRSCHDANALGTDKGLLLAFTAHAPSSFMAGTIVVALLFLGFNYK